MFDSVAGLLRGEAPTHLANALGADRQDTRRAMEVGLPALIGGLRDKTNEAGGADDLFELLQSDQPNPVSNVGGYLAAGDPKQGASQLDRVFGDRGESALTSLGKASGLSTRLLAQVMSMLAPVATGWLSNKAKDDALDAQGVRSYLADETRTLEDRGFGKVFTLLGGASAGAAAAAPSAKVGAAMPDADVDPGMPAEIGGDVPADGTYADGAYADGGYADGEYAAEGQLDDVHASAPTVVVDGGERVEVDTGDSFELAPPHEYETVEADRGGWLWWVVAALATIVFLALLISQCGGGGDDPNTEAAETPAATAEPSGDSVIPEPAPAAPAPVGNSIQDELNTALAPYPGVTGIVDGDIATLTGSADTEQIRVAAGDVAAGVAGIASVNNQITVVNPGNTVDRVIASRPELSTLSVLLTESELSNPLAAGGPFTVFAPSDEAFSSLGDSLTALRQDSTALNQTLSYHVVSGAFPAAELANQPLLTTVQGDSIQVAADGASVRINGVTLVLEADIQADNGVVHIVSGVLNPPSLGGGISGGIELGSTLGLNPITFAPGSANLTAEGQAELDRVVQFLQESPQPVEIAGHTDADGDEASNQALSESRANAVRDYLVNAGIPADSLTAVGFGETQPIAPNDKPEDKAKNRRIEFNT